MQKGLQILCMKLYRLFRSLLRILFKTAAEPSGSLAADCRLLNAEGEILAVFGHIDVIKPVLAAGFFVISGNVAVNLKIINVFVKNLALGALNAAKSAAVVIKPDAKQSAVVHHCGMRNVHQNDVRKLRRAVLFEANIAVNIGQINVLEAFIRTESINIAFNKLRFLGLNAETV